MAKQWVRRTMAAMLGAMRQGNPPVLWGAEPMNGGNYLYLWVTAWKRRQETGRPWTVRYKPKMAPWLSMFPSLRGLTVSGASIGVLQQRTVEWGQRAYVDWEYRDLTEFSRSFLLPSGPFRELIEKSNRSSVVINVRRGDYYTNPEHRKNFGFEIEAYVRAAVARIPEPDVTGFVIVSDDVDWCLDHLGFLHDLAPVATVPGPHDMFKDLAQIAAGRHLVLANSTFSYWGGYLSSALPAEVRARSVQAPLHFNRQYLGGHSPLLLPQWRAMPDDEFLRE